MDFSGDNKITSDVRHLNRTFGCCRPWHFIYTGILFKTVKLTTQPLHVTHYLIYSFSPLCSLLSSLIPSICQQPAMQSETSKKRMLFPRRANTSSKPLNTVHSSSEDEPVQESSNQGTPHCGSVPATWIQSYPIAEVSIREGVQDGEEDLGDTTHWIGWDICSTGERVVRLFRTFPYVTPWHLGKEPCSELTYLLLLLHKYFTLKFIFVAFLGGYWMSSTIVPSKDRVGADLAMAMQEEHYFASAGKNRPHG